MEFPPLSARSVALSVLLGAPDRGLPVRALINAGEMCGIAPPTMRVALSRLTSTGELSVEDSVYALSPAHQTRRLAQQRDLEPRLRPWNGQWETVVVVETGRDAADRARLRTALTEARLAELREGVWMRPANLDRPFFSDPHTTTFASQPMEPDRVAEQLWDLAAWAETGRRLLAVSAGPELDGRRFAAITGLVRHLRTDPALPPEMTPRNWPADDMRAAYDAYKTQLRTEHIGVPA